MVQALVGKVPPSVINYIVENGPGAGVAESYRLGGQASGLYRDGRYLESLDRFADAVDARLRMFSGSYLGVG